MRNNINALVIKFGGSNTILDDGANKDYLLNYLTHFREIFPNLEKIALVIGGGQRVRLRQAQVETNEEKDQIGIETTWEHAQSLKEVADELGLMPCDKIAHSPEEAKEILASNRVTVMGGLQIGQSTDAVSAFAAHRFKREGYEPALIILSNIDSIYTADPKKEQNAKPIKRSSVPTLVSEGVLINDPKKWVPGMAITIDPVAVSLLQLDSAKQEIPLYFGQGDNWKNVLSYINEQDVTDGTILDPDATTTEFWE